MDRRDHAGRWLSGGLLPADDVAIPSRLLRQQCRQISPVGRLPVEERQFAQQHPHGPRVHEQVMKRPQYDAFAGRQQRCRDAPRRRRMEREGALRFGAGDGVERGVGFADVV
jgi:hypothetical protein